MPILPKLFTDLIKENYDVVVADKGYSFCKTRNWRLETAKRIYVGDDFEHNILSSLNANKSKEITCIRNVVENIIGILKLQWKKLHTGVVISVIPKLYKIVPIFCGIRNIYFEPIRKDTSDTEKYAKEFHRRRKKKVSNDDLERIRPYKGWSKYKYKNQEKGWQVLSEFVNNSKWLPKITEKMLYYLLLGKIFFYFKN